MNKKKYTNGGRQSPPLMPIGFEQNRQQDEVLKDDLKSVHHKINQVLNDAIERIGWHISCLPRKPSAEQWTQAGQSFDHLMKLYHRLLTYQAKLDDFNPPPSRQRLYTEQSYTPDINDPAYRQSLIDDIMIKLSKYQKRPQNKD